MVMGSSHWKEPSFRMTWWAMALQCSKGVVTKMELPGWVLGCCSSHGVQWCLWCWVDAISFL